MLCFESRVNIKHAPVIFNNIPVIATVITTKPPNQYVNNLYVSMFCSVHFAQSGDELFIIRVFSTLEEVLAKGRKK